MDPNSKASAFDLHVRGDSRLLDAISRRTPSSPGGVSHFPGGTIITPSRQSKRPINDTPCPFGKIVTWMDGETQKTGISGGVVSCADKNLSVEDNPINLDVDSSSLIFLSIDCTANTDDLGELLLPGLASCESTAGGVWGSLPWSAGAQYPDNENPVVSSPGGTITLPLGKLVIKDKVATFDATGCGGFAINHCAGTLSYARS